MSTVPGDPGLVASHLAAYSANVIGSGSFPYCFAAVSRSASTVLANATAASRFSLKERSCCLLPSSHHLTVHGWPHLLGVWHLQRLNGLVAMSIAPGLSTLSVPLSFRL